MRGKTAIKISAGLAATALLVTACGGGGSDEPTSSSAVVSIEVAEPQYLLPSNTNETSGSQVLAALFSPLVDYDADNKPVEVAAESISTTDNITWTIKLKDGYTFHNGEKVTSDSYINAWNYGSYGPNGQNNSYFWEKIEGWSDLQSEDPDGEEGPQKAPDPKAKTLTGLVKVDDLTFTVKLAAAFSEFKTMLGYTAFYPLPAAAFASEGVIKEGFEDAIIGNGPFKMKARGSTTPPSRSRPTTSSRARSRRWAAFSSASTRRCRRPTPTCRVTTWTCSRRSRRRASPPPRPTWATGSRRARPPRSSSSRSRRTRPSSASPRSGAPSRRRSTATRSSPASSRARSPLPAPSSPRSWPVTARTPAVSTARSTPPSEGRVHRGRRPGEDHHHLQR